MRPRPTACSVDLSDERRRQRRTAREQLFLPAVLAVFGRVGRCFPEIVVVRDLLRLREWRGVVVGVGHAAQCPAWRAPTPTWRVKVAKGGRRLLRLERSGWQGRVEGVVEDRCRLADAWRGARVADGAFVDRTPGYNLAASPHT